MEAFRFYAAPQGPGQQEPKTESTSDWVGASARDPTSELAESQAEAEDKIRKSLGWVGIPSGRHEPRDPIGEALREEQLRLNTGWVRIAASPEAQRGTPLGCFSAAAQLVQLGDSEAVVAQSRNTRPTTATRPAPGKTLHGTQHSAHDRSAQGCIADAAVSVEESRWQRSEVLPPLHQHASVSRHDDKEFEDEPGAQPASGLSKGSKQMFDEHYLLDTLIKAAAERTAEPSRDEPWTREQASISEPPATVAYMTDAAVFVAESGWQRSEALLPFHQHANVVRHDDTECEGSSASEETACAER